MSAFKLTARIVAAVVGVVAFASSCGQLIGVPEVEMPPLRPGDQPKAIICENGQTRCDDRLLQLCTDEGTAWATLEVCATADLCRGTDSATVAACIPPACSDEQMSCDGNLLRLCNASRTGWELFATCESAAHCDAGARQCLPSPCEPGDRRCNVGNLERCSDDRTAWEPLDTCVTNELCESTLNPPVAASEGGTTAGLPGLAPPASDAEGPTECRQPVCVPREVRCDVSRLIACNEGQTEFTQAEDCQTAKLCDASITYTGLRGAPRCVRPTCAVGEHRCSDTGVLEVCNADRDGFDPIEACIGPQFCNAVAADNGEPGCEAAPCEAGDEQCNGPQIQRCLEDRTGFEAVGAACETRGLCNDDGASAFCAPPVCQRGPLSGTEFRCDGTTLQRCNDQHTGFDPIATCATPGLCNAGFGFDGCRPPVCAPGETRCSGNFVQRCNAQRTAFENVEQCAAGTCDSALGRCADPCVPGSARCNAQGNLEECRDLLAGREITARCGSPQLCDAQVRACRQPPPGCTADGVRVCNGNSLQVCSDGRSRFVTLDTCAAGEVCDPSDTQCDVCVQGSEPTCEGNTLVTCANNGQSEIPTNCPFGCQVVPNGPDRCRTCVPGSVDCQGDQLVVCRARNGGEFNDREACDSTVLCSQTETACQQNGSGESCRCQAGVCDPGDRDCQGAQPVACNDAQTAFTPSGPSCGGELDCNPRPVGECFPCSVGDVQCGADSIMEGCRSDRSGFDNLPGAQPRAVRCISSNGGAFIQFCDGASLREESCQSGLCNANGGGCAECSEDTFVPECTTVGGRPGRTQCVNGQIESNACPPSDGCTDFVCDDGTCNPTLRREGQCIRANGQPGVCSADARCVQCNVDGDCGAGRFCNNGTCGDCDGGTAACNGQTLTVCSADGVPTVTQCGGAIECQSGETCNAELRRCDPRTDLPLNSPCTGGSCDGAGTCNEFDCTPGSVTCEGNTIVRCSQQGTESREACDPETECREAAVCNPAGNGSCTPGTPKTGDSCAGGLCADNGTCDPFDCVPNQCERLDLESCRRFACSDDLQTCEAGAGCSAPTPVCNGNGGCVVCLIAGNVGCGEGQVCNGTACVTQTQCGNGDCEDGETEQNCAADCAPRCPATCQFGCLGNSANCACDNASDCPDTDNNPCVLRQCRADATACQNITLDDGSDCGDGRSCQAGVCQTPQPVCGNGDCEQPQESSNNCAQDCGPPPPVCGNGACEQPQESSNNCSEDCGPPPPVCGNGNCEQPQESSNNCSEDCGPPVPVCGNGNCEMGEGSNNCAEDCGPPAPVCGNGACEQPQESSNNCTQDCGPPPPVCGNGACEQPQESSNNCVQDCGPPPPVCGDGACEQPQESSNNCVQDCGPPPPVCGNGACEQPQESSNNCTQDCGPPPPVCGNGACEQPQESSDNCAQDCGAPSTNDDLPTDDNPAGPPGGP